MKTDPMPGPRLHSRSRSPRQPVRRLRERIPWHGLGTLAAALALTTTIAAQGPLVGDNTQITWPLGLANGLDGHTNAAVAYSATDDLFLVVHESTVTAGGSTTTTVAGRFVSGAGVALGTGSCGLYAVSRSIRPKVAWNRNRNEFLLVWEMDDHRIGDPCGPGVPVDKSVVAQRLAYDPNGTCGAFRLIGGAFYVSGLPAVTCDTVYDVEPDVAFGAGDYLVVWTNHDTVANRKKVLGQFVAGVPDGGSGGGQLLGARRTLCSSPPGIADYQEAAVAFDPDEPCFAIACRYTVAGNQASDVMGQVLTPWSAGGSVVYAAYLAIGQSSRAAGRPVLAYGEGSGHFLVAWPDLQLSNATTRRTIWAQRAVITSSTFTPVGANFLVSGSATGAVWGDAVQCAVAYDRSTEDRFVVAFDHFCNPTVCLPPERGDVLVRSVAGQAGGGTGGGEFFGSMTSLVDAQGTQPAQQRPAVASGARRATLLVPWDDDRPVATVNAPYKIFGQRARSTFEVARLSASDHGVYRALDTAYFQVFGPPDGALMIDIAVSLRSPPLGLPPPFVGSLCLGDPLALFATGVMGSDGAWVTNPIPIPLLLIVPATFYFQAAVFSPTVIDVTNCTTVQIVP